jgi:hypothetical protein
MPSRTYTAAERMILAKANRLLQNPEVQDLSNLSRVQDPVIYKGQQSHSKTSRKGGSPPREYGAVEYLADLKNEMAKEQPDLQHVTRCYTHLNAILRL